MRISGFHVDGFGLLHDQQVGDVPPGTTVVLGPNEAGKSTLHAFLVRTLFGHPRANDAAGRNRHEPLAGGAHGGTVWCRDDDGEWAVHRYTDRSPALRVVTPDGTEATGNDAVLPLVGRTVDATRYEQVFAIDLDDLGGVGSLGEGALDDLLFDAATVGTGRSLRAARDEAVDRRDALWTPAARKRPLSRAISARAEARRRLAQARDAARENLDLRRRLDAAAERVQQLTEQQQQLAARTGLLERVRDAWPAWRRAQRAREASDELPSPALDPDDVAAVRTADEALAQLADQRTQLEQQREELAGRTAGVEVDQQLVAAAGRVTELAEGLGAHELVVEQLAGARRAADDADGRVRDALAQLGDDWDPQRVAAASVDAATHEHLAVATDELVAARTAATAARERAEEAATLAARRNDQLARRTTAVPPPPDAAQVVRSEEAVAVLRSGVPTLQQAAVLAEARHVAQEGPRGAREAPQRPWGRWAGVALLTAGAVLAVLLLAQSVGLPWPVAVIGAGLVVAVAVLLLRAGLVGGPAEAPARSPGRSVPDPDAGPATDQLEAEVAAAARTVGLEPVPTVAQVEQVATRVARARGQLQESDAAARELATLREEAERADEQAEKLDRRAREADQQRDELLRAWTERCEDAGVSSDQPPRVALAEHARVREAARALAAAQEATAAVEPLQLRVERYRSEVAEVVTELDQSRDGADAVRALPGLRRRVATAVEAAGQRRRLREQLDELEDRDQRLAEQLDDARRERDAALGRLGLDDVAALDAAEADVVRREELDQELRTARDELDRLLGSGPSGEEGRRLLAAEDPTAWEQELAAADREAADLRTRRDDALAERTELAAQLERLGGDDAVPRAAQRLATAEAELAELAERWAVADTAARLLEETVARFEREQQPRVLARASQLFARATSGAWAEVRRLDEQVVVARQRGGTPVRASVLSRGTREQLWLSLRLALAEDLTRDRPLPLLVDDLLGASDPQRSLDVARVLAEVARRQQVLLFTCHPATAELVCRTDPTAAVLELRRGGVVGGWRRRPSAVHDEDVPQLEL